MTPKAKRALAARFLAGESLEQLAWMTARPKDENRYEEHTREVEAAIRESVVLRPERKRRPRRKR